MKNLWQKITLTLISLAVVPTMVFPFSAAAQTPGTVIGRAATRAQRIAAATERLAVAKAALLAVDPLQGIPGLPVADGGLRAKAAIDAAKEVADAATELQDANTSIQEDVLNILEKVLFQSLKKKILDMVVDQIIGYIQGEGSPRFITDWQGFFRDIAQGAVGDLAQALGAGFLCSPFSIPIRLQIAASLAPVERFKTKFNCTLDQIVGNIDNFYADFRNGGWKAYDVAWEPQNNYYGAVWLAWDAEQNTIAGKLVNAANELIANNGFLGVRKCYDIKTGKETTGDSATGFSAGEQAALGIECHIVTPGKALGDLTAKAIGADIDFIVNSEDLSAYIASIANALINRVIKEGVGLAGVSIPSAPQKVRTRDEIDNIIYGSQNIPAGVKDAASKYQDVISNNKTTITQQLNLVNDARTLAAANMDQRFTLEDGYLAKIQTLVDCETTKSGIFGASVATKKKHDDQLAVVNNLQSQITANQEAKNQLEFNLQELSTLTESQVTANLAHYQDLVAGYTDALQLKQSAERDLATAQATIPGLIAGVDKDITACKAK